MFAVGKVSAVAKGKRSPALFEVINRAQISGQEPRLQIPQWWRNTLEAAQGDPNLAPPPSPEGTVVRQEPAENEALKDPAPPPITEHPAIATPTLPIRPEPDWTQEEEEESHASESLDEAPQPGWTTESDPPTESSADVPSSIVRVSDGRIMFSLDLAGAVITVGVVILTLTASFVIGHHYGRGTGYELARQSLQDQAVDSVERARRMQPDGSVLALGNSDPSAGSVKASVVPARRPSAPSAPAVSKPSESESPAKVSRHLGWNYLLIQHCRGEDARNEAMKAERFICSQLPAENGQPPVTVEPHPDGGFMVLSTLGYASGDAVGKEAFRRFQESIVNVGKLYRQRGGGYDFRDAYAMKLSRIPKGR